MTKITKLPITHKQRQINLHDFGYVPCEVSGRYLQFDETYCKENNFVFVDVMTTDTASEKPKKTLSALSGCGTTEKSSP